MYIVEKPNCYYFHNISILYVYIIYTNTNEIHTHLNDFVFNLLLSESSMFVSKRRWILKTCGTTTTLECLEPLLRLAETLAGYSDVDYLFYSRKNFKRPDLQTSPHRAFEEEVSLLDTFFESGRAYCLGSINRDCWYLYTYNREGGIAEQQQYDDIGHFLSVEPDQTIEILMTDLDPDIMAIFTKEECKNASEATKVNEYFHIQNKGASSCKI